MDKSNLLEYFNNTVTKPVNEHGAYYEISKCNCRSWFCPDCCVTRGYNLRAKLVPILQKFKGIIMASLTVDPKLFPNPEKAYLYTMDKRCISVTTQDLKRGGYLYTGKYFYVVEWQKETEQAHYHIIYDSRFIPFHELLKFWSKHRPENAGEVIGKRPAFGTVILSKIKFNNPLHAARYVTKYLIKTPDHGYPIWVMDTGEKRRIRRFSTSRSFWGHTAHRRQTMDKTNRKNKQQTYRQRISKCGDSLNVFRIIEKLDPATGEITASRKWVGQIKAPADLVLDKLFDPGNPKRRRRSLIANNTNDITEVIENIIGEKVHWTYGGNNREIA